METDSPTFVYRDGMTADKEYVQWLLEVKARFRQSQIKAAVRVNTAMLEFYWSVGRDLVRLRAERKWGAGVVKQFALDMREAFPGESGFSYTNVKDMKRWYLFYYERVVKSQQVAGLLDAKKRQQVAVFIGDDAIGTPTESLFSSLEKSQQSDGLFEMPAIFGQIPWGQHVEIISKSKSLEEAVFYVDKVVSEGWSRSKLEEQIAAKLFQTQGSAINNFSHTLPSPQSQLASEILKDPYNFGFLSMTQGYVEKDLEEALVKNVTQFLLELGKGFSYVGRQMELQMPGGQTFYPDLVFYHIPQHRYVIIELKAVKYIPEFAGKLNFYVTAADELLRGEGDNPSVGLIICKSTDKTIVEWSLKDINKPLGVATYQLQEVVDRTVAELEQRNKKKQIEVSCAIIHDQQGRIFATQRGHGEWRGWWEFPGGKLEPGETPQQALQREIREELQAEIAVERHLTTVEYDYPTFHLTMHCYLCHVQSGTLTLTEHQSARWLSPNELHTLQWLPADLEVVERLRSEVRSQ